MDTETAERLRKLNNDFYTTQAASFSSTRNNSWAGWERAVDAVAPVLGADPLRVFDLACGNLRFERFLAEKIAGNVEFVAADSNMDMLKHKVFDCCGAQVKTFCYDALCDDAGALGWFEDVDLSVCFGFMHHVPTCGQRRRVLETLCSKTKPGGYVVVSFWQFMNDPRLAKKAHEATAAAEGIIDTGSFSEGDWLLGWQSKPDTWRYCHHYSECEIDELGHIVDDRAELVAGFCADGKSGDLNAYRVWRVR